LRPFSKRGAVHPISFWNFASERTALSFEEPKGHPLEIAAAVTTITEIKYVAVNGDKLAYVELGQGDPVIFVHGGLQDYRFWNGHLARFANRYRVIAYSRRNYYPNSVSGEGAPDGAADIHGEDLAALVTELHLARIHVVAHSAGAHAVLFFAANHPTLVRTLVLNEPPATGLLLNAAGSPAMLKKFGDRLAPSREAFRDHDLERAGRLFIDAVGGPGTYERRSEAERRMMMDNALAHVADATTSRPRPLFTCEMAQRITVPTLLTTGERSPKFFSRIMDELERCLPNRERLQILGASHTVPGENQQAFDEAVLAFWRNIDQNRDSN
jgi:non-heme chloroperoxidase